MSASGCSGGGITLTFSDGTSLDDTKKLLVLDPSYNKKIPPVEIGIFKNKVFSFDTRRLITHMKAWEENPSVMIRYKKISGEYLKTRVEAIFSPRPWNGLVTAERFGGKNSASEPYINPAYRNQLESKVFNLFKKFPSDRTSYDDLNGFPTGMQKAKKIYSFLDENAKNGSFFADNILKKSKHIGQEQGKEAAYEYLISRKNRSNSI